MPQSSLDTETREALCRPRRLQDQGAGKFNSLGSSYSSGAAHLSPGNASMQADSRYSRAAKHRALCGAEHCGLSQAQCCALMRGITAIQQSWCLMSRRPL